MKQISNVIVILSIIAFVLFLPFIWGKSMITRTTLAYVFLLLIIVNFLNVLLYKYQLKMRYLSAIILSKNSKKDSIFWWAIILFGTIMAIDGFGIITKDTS